MKARSWVHSQYEARVRPALVAAVDGYSWAEEHAFVREWFTPVDGPLLDLACGGGDHTRLLVQAFGAQRVVAADLDPNALLRARDALTRTPGARHDDTMSRCAVPLIRCDAASLPVASAALGGVICFGGLALFARPAAVFAELQRCMKPGAPLVGVCPARPRSHLGRAAVGAMGHRTWQVEPLTKQLAAGGLQRLKIVRRGWTILFAARKS